MVRTSDTFRPNHVNGSSPPLRDQPIALIRRNLEFLDCLLDRGLLIGLVIDDADELSRRPADMVDGPGTLGGYPGDGTWRDRQALVYW